MVLHNLMMDINQIVNRGSGGESTRCTTDILTLVLTARQRSSRIIIKFCHQQHSSSQSSHTVRYQVPRVYLIIC